MLAAALVSLLFAMPHRPAQTHGPLELRAREFFTNFVAGRFDVASKDFSDSMRTTVPPQMLADLHAEIEGQVGAFQFITAARPQKADGFQGIELVAQYEKAPVSVRVLFDSASRIGQVLMNPLVSPAPDPKLEQSAREILDAFIGDHLPAVTARFDATMKTQLPPKRLAEVREQVMAAFGTFGKVNEVKQRADSEHRIVEIFASCERLPMIFRVVFDGQGSVAGLDIRPLKING